MRLRILETVSLAVHRCERQVSSELGWLVHKRHGGEREESKQKATELCFLVPDNIPGVDTLGHYIPAVHAMNGHSALPQNRPTLFRRGKVHRPWCCYAPPSGLVKTWRSVVRFRALYTAPTLSPCFVAS